MVIGFFFSFAMMSVFGQVLSLGIHIAFAGLRAGNTSGLFTFLGLLAVTGGLLVAIVHRIYGIPTWLGEQSCVGFRAKAICWVSSRLRATPGRCLERSFRRRGWGGDVQGWPGQGALRVRRWRRRGCSRRPSLSGVVAVPCPKRAGLQAHPMQTLHRACRAVRLHRHRQIPRRRKTPGADRARKKSRAGPKKHMQSTHCPDLWGEL